MAVMVPMKVKGYETNSPTELNNIKIAIHAASKNGITNAFNFHKNFAYKNKCKQITNKGEIISHTFSNE